VKKQRNSALDREQHIYRVGQKNRAVLRVDNFATVAGRNAKRLSGAVAKYCNDVKRRLLH